MYVCERERSPFRENKPQQGPKGLLEAGQGEDEPVPWEGARAQAPKAWSRFSTSGWQITTISSE